MEEKKGLFPLNLQMFADEGGAAEEGTDTGTGTEDKKDDQSQGEDKKFTQADIDKAIKDRLAREKQKFQKQLDDLKKTADTDGGDSGTEEVKTDVDDKSATLLAQANKRLLEATATTEAVKLGVDPKYVGDVVKLANLSAVEVGEDGDIDASKISKEIDEVLKRLPMLKTTAENAGGFKVGGDQSNKSKQSTSWKPSGEANVKRWNRTNRF